MCRHIAYLGPPTTLRSVLIDPPDGLYRQAWAPRQMRHGTVNADGFGVGWYSGGDPTPARYRRAVPIWADESLPDIARVTRSGAVLAAVRNATEGMAAGERAAAPFASGPWLFSHNGVLAGWPAAAVPVAEKAGASAATLLSLEALVDSAFLWALVLERLRAGRSMGVALSETIGAVEAAGANGATVTNGVVVTNGAAVTAGRFNFLLTDGRSIAATACGDTLWYRRSGDAVVVASEPGDDEPDWTEVPDRHVLTATPSLVSVRPLVPSATDPEPSSTPSTPSTSSTPSTAETVTSAPKGSLTR
jgi:gamma-glutamyl hercynylcysteine S-oxide hydrolase